jgi:hypothetical protein
MKIDVIIPLKSYNNKLIENIEKISIFSKVNRILIGDAGIPDHIRKNLESIDKVKIINHINLQSQGGSIRDLIRLCTTEFFVYLHADVTLPEDWFEIMERNMKHYDFAECKRIYNYNITIEDKKKREGFKFRALSGSQMGRTKFVNESLMSLEDDYLFRNEDIVIADLIRENNGRYGIVDDTFHLHQIGHKVDENITSDTEISLRRNFTQKDVWVFENHLLGIIKYCKPDCKEHIWNFDHGVSVLKFLKTDLKKIKKQINSLGWLLIYYTYSARMALRRIKKILNVAVSHNKDLL